MKSYATLLAVSGSILGCIRRAERAHHFARHFQVILQRGQSLGCKRPDASIPAIPGFLLEGRNVILMILHHVAGVGASNASPESFESLS